MPITRSQVSASTTDNKNQKEKSPQKTKKINKNNTQKVLEVIDRLSINDILYYCVKIEGCKNTQVIEASKLTSVHDKKLIDNFNKSHSEFLNKKRKPSTTIKNEKKPTEIQEITLSSNTDDVEITNKKTRKLKELLDKKFLKNVKVGDINEDIPKMVVNVGKIKNDDKLYCEVCFEQKGNKKINNAIIKTSEMAEKYPLELIKFYEDRLIFSQELEK